MAWQFQMSELDAAMNFSPWSFCILGGIGLVGYLIGNQLMEKESNLSRISGIVITSTSIYLMAPAIILGGAIIGSSDCLKSSCLSGEN